MPEAVGQLPTKTAAPPSRRAAYWALGVLTAINLLNYLDRYVVAPLATDLKRDMSLSDTQLGSLLTAFILVYMVAAPVFGAWGDRGSRTRPIALGIGHLEPRDDALGPRTRLPTPARRARAGRDRRGLGRGHRAVAARGPVCAARPRARVRDTQHGDSGRAPRSVTWSADRWGHTSAGARLSSSPAPRASLLAIASLWLPDPPRGIQDADTPAAPQRRRSPRVAQHLPRPLRARTPFRVVVLGYAAYTFALGGLAFWMPTFLERVRGIPKADAATTDFGVIVLATGLVGTFAGGWLGGLPAALFRGKRTCGSPGWSRSLAAPLALACARAPRTGRSTSRRSSLRSCCCSCRPGR